MTSAPGLREAPLAPEHWPADYVARKCWICGSWTTNPCPYTQAGDELRLWKGYTVWDQGNAREHPGYVDRLYRTVWLTGDWGTRFKTLPTFKQAKNANPTVVHTFLAHRAELVKMKHGNVHQLRCSYDL